MLEATVSDHPTIQSSLIRYGSLLLISISIAVSDFLLFVPFTLGIYQIIHIAALIVPAAILFLDQQTQSSLIQKILPSLTFFVMFTLWSTLLFIEIGFTNLIPMLGLILLMAWHSQHNPYAHWLSLTAVIVLIGMLKLLSNTPVITLLAFSLLALSPIVFFRLNPSRSLAKAASSPATSADDYFETDNNETVSEEDFNDELFEPEQAIVNMTTNGSTHDWEQVLRELNTELKHTPDVDRMLKSMLLFMSGAVEHDAASAGMLHERTISKVASTGPDSLTHSKVLSWNNERLKKIIEANSEILSQQDHLDEDGKPQTLCRLDIPLFSNNKVIGLVTLFRENIMFNEYEAKLASSIVFHSMIALKQARLHEEIKRLSGASTKKSLFSREQFVEKSQTILKELNKPRTFSLLILEIDNYDSVNEKYGHAVLNNLYKKLASIIMTETGDDDIIGRYGKEGFVVLLNQTELMDAQKKAESLREKISALSIKSPHGIITTTVSIGLTTVSDPEDEISALIRKADMGLFVAKESGKNTVKVSL